MKINLAAGVWFCSADCQGYGY